MMGLLGGRIIQSRILESAELALTPTCVAKGLDATPCTIDRCNAASIAYSKQAYMKVAVQRARTHRPKHC